MVMAKCKQASLVWLRPSKHGLSLTVYHPLTHVTLIFHPGHGKSLRQPEGLQSASYRFPTPRTRTCRKPDSQQRPSPAPANISAWANMDSVSFPPLNLHYRNRLFLGLRASVMANLLHFPTGYA